MSELLKIEGLTAEAGGKKILDGIDLTVEAGQTHVIMGPNGAGKSTLGAVIMGSPEYTVTAGRILWEGEDITEETPDKRARRGIFLSFQNPVEVPGLTLSAFLRSANEAVTGEHVRLWSFRKMLEEAMGDLGLDPSYADRELNVGFSGGEKKKSEVLQMLILRPRLAILDETDSGLDVDAVKTVAAGIKAYMDYVGGTLIIITHNDRLLEDLAIDATHVMVTGRIAAEGGAELARKVYRNGFEEYLNMGRKEG